EGLGRDRSGDRQRRDGGRVPQALRFGGADDGRRTQSENRHRAAVGGSVLRFILATLCLLSFQWPVSAEVRTSLPDQVDPARTYVFYLHGRIVEGAGPRPYDPRFGVYDYPAVLDALASRGAVVIASQREPDADPDIHAGRVVSQVERLLRAGVPEHQVVVAGFSKGGMIARHVSAFLHRDGVRYVLLGAC